MALSRSVCALALVVSLAACGKRDKDEANLAALDAQLTNETADPAVKGALADQIVVDPQLVGQSNRNAVRTADKPANAALPILSGDADKAQKDALRIAGGKLLPAPAPGKGEEMASKVTLGALAREQGHGGQGGGCAKKLVYANGWAQRLPEPFTLYPGANLTEAAGAERDGCTLRAASFTTPVPKARVIDFYYTQARRAGFSADHRLIEGDHVLGGTRGDDGSAYFLLFTDGPRGGTSVDIIADNGR